MEKIIAAFDGLQYSESTRDYAVDLAKQADTHLVGVFLDDPSYTSYKIYDLIAKEGVSEDKLNKFELKDKSARAASSADFEKACQKAGLEYKASASAKDDSGLLAAAEKLHSQFETLVRTIRPALRELDDFHAVLYMLYHHYLPKSDMPNIRSSAMELKQKMTALNAAKLPDRLKQKEQAFQAARAKLSASVEALETSIHSNSEPKLKEGVNAVHNDYQALDRLFQ